MITSSEASIVSYLWEYTVEYKPDELVDEYKACFYTKYFSQPYGIDYFEIGGPI